jgi:hypothetical protein
MYAKEGGMNMYRVIKGGASFRVASCLSISAHHWLRHIVLLLH